LKKIIFLRIELKDPKFNYNFDGNQLSAAISSKINPYEGETVLHKFLLILAKSKQILRCSLIKYFQQKRKILKCEILAIKREWRVLESTEIVFQSPYVTYQGSKRMYWT
jgi:hypothetical protein